MLEASFLSPAYRIVKDIWSAMRGRKRQLSADEIVQLRQKWKSEIEAKLWDRRREGLRTDIIVRDMKRVDNYPDTEDKKKGASSWFRAGLMGTYHKGVLLGLRWGSLTLDSKIDKYRYTNYKNGEKGDIKVILIGYVKYEDIEAVDWEGDEFYGLPHFYCYFNTKSKEPYERLAYCEQKHLNDIPFYTDVADFNEVHKLRKKAGVEYFA